MCHCSISSDMISHMNLGRQFSCLKIFHQPSIVRNCCVIGEGNPKNHQTSLTFLGPLGKWRATSSQINETHCRFEFEVPTKSDHLLTNEYTKHQLDKNYMELHFLYESCCISTIDMKHVVATLKKTLSPYLPSKRDLVEKVVAETRGKKNGKKNTYSAWERKKDKHDPLKGLTSYDLHLRGSFVLSPTWDYAVTHASRRWANVRSWCNLGLRAVKKSWQLPLSQNDVYFYFRVNNKNIYLISLSHSVEITKTHDVCVM